MRFCSATEEHKAAFTQWNTAFPLEERTCRPIVNGKRATPDDRVVTLAFFHDDVSSTEPVGRFVYFDINPRNRSAECGYCVSPDYRGQGLGTTMLTLALDHLFATTDLNKLYCQTAAFNMASVKLLERLKFHKDGILREHHELAGMLWDDYVFSMLRREWVERKPCKQQDYTIRSYTPADEAKWLQCRVLAFLDTAYFDTVCQEKEHYANPSIELVAEFDGQIIGLIDIECEEKPGSVCSPPAIPRPIGKAGMIWTLAVHPDYRRQGVATALLAAAIDLTQEAQLCRLEAWTRDDASTLQWYESQGFQRMDTYLHVYLQGDEVKQGIHSRIPGLRLIHTFAHYRGDSPGTIRQQCQRVHDCNRYDLILRKCP